jgi:hypothetical protein
MGQRFEKRTDGLERLGPILKTPLRCLPFEHDLGACFSSGDSLFCSSPGEGFVVYREETMQVISRYGNVEDVIGPLEDRKILLWCDEKFAVFNCIQMVLDDNAAAAPYSFGAVNQCVDGEFLYLLGVDRPEGEGLLARARAKKKILSYEKSPFRLKWSLEMPPGSVCHFLVDKKSELLYVIDSDANILCCDSNGNQLLQRSFLESFSSASTIIETQPALIESSIVLIYTGVTLSISAKDGSLLWKRKAATGSWGLISEEHKIYQLETSLKDKSRSLITLDATTGELLASNLLYTNDGSSICNDLAYRNPLHWSLTSTHLVIGWSHGLITVIDPATGEISWYVNLSGEEGEVTVVGLYISNNRLYCRTSTSGMDAKFKSWVFEGVGGYGAT